MSGLDEVVNFEASSNPAVISSELIYNHRFVYDFLPSSSFIRADGIETFYKVCATTRDLDICCDLIQLPPSISFRLGYFLRYDPVKHECLPLWRLGDFLRRALIHYLFSLLSSFFVAVSEGAKIISWAKIVKKSWANIRVHLLCIGILGEKACVCPCVCMQGCFLFCFQRTNARDQREWWKDT